MHNSPKFEDVSLRGLMREVALGKAQLPEFQRDWRWDDNRIVGILTSLALGYPMGALMRLVFNPQENHFKYRPIEGVVNTNTIPEFLFLDGQQRLTSIYRATCSKEPVDTKTEKSIRIQRFYYLDINKCLMFPDDLDDAIISVPADKRVKENFNRDIILDLSTRELEYHNEMFPMNLVFNVDDFYVIDDWADGYKDYHKNEKEFKDKFKKFNNDVLKVITDYRIPVITLDKDTPNVAVCKVFENVNTGGVPLTVFELVTAIFASKGFDLRQDWEETKNVIQGKDERLKSDILDGIDETAFLTTITLYSNYHSNQTVSCKKKDVLSLSYESYKECKDSVVKGFKKVRHFLNSQCVFLRRDLPYTTQLIPLAAICASIDDSTFNQPRTQKILSRWFWCGILGEMYGGANETRFANDIVDVINEIKVVESNSKTVNEAYFSSTRLLTLKSRNSAAYKGIIALIFYQHSLDLMNDTPLCLLQSSDSPIDIHHIFPEAYCKGENFDKKKLDWDCIINKTPLSAASNRQIGGKAPRDYSQKIMKDAGIDENELRTRVESNFINFDYFIQNDYKNYFISRAKSLLVLIEKAMDKKINDRGSEETIRAFGCSLE